MEIDEAIRKRRSIRKFKQKEIGINILKELIGYARIAPSAANVQPLEYYIVTDDSLRSEVFGNLKWAGYIAPEGDPKDNERPVAYIIVLVNKNKKSFPPQRDVGAAVENILLAAINKNIGSCWLGAINRKNLTSILELPSKYKIDSVIALGYPKEEAVTEKSKNGDIKYWKDEQGTLHVPKRSLDEVIYKKD